MLLYFSPGKQDVLEGMRRAQRRRFALAAIMIKGGFPAGGGAPAEELRSVDPRTLRDRAGRPVLTAAIAEKRPWEVLASLAEALKRQGGQRQGVAPAGTGRFAGVGVVLDFEILEEFAPPLRHCIRAAL
eukprot:jgi/Tetstr1/450230/TSEL_037268.t1